MSRWNLPPWMTLGVTIVASTAGGTWIVAHILGGMDKNILDLQREVCALRVAVEAKGPSLICGADGRPDLQAAAFTTRSGATLPKEPVGPLLLAYLGIGACTTGSVCLLLFAQRFGSWADRRQLEERVTKLEAWRDADPTVPPHNPDDKEVDCA